MLRMMRLVLLSGLAIGPLTALIPQPSQAANQKVEPVAPDEAKAEFDARVKAEAQEKARKLEEEKARRLAASIEACDKGAAYPLDPTAKAAPITYYRLFPADFDRKKLVPLQVSCQEAWAGRPGERRFQMQWLRVTLAMGGPGTEWAMPQLTLMADSGIAEAQYLMFVMYRQNHSRPNSGMVISRADAVAYLIGAAQQGHIPALQELLQQYRSGPFVARDAQMAVKVAQQIETAPPQGNVDTAWERDIKARVPMVVALMTLSGKGFNADELAAAFKLVEAEAQNPSSSVRPAAMAYITALRLGIGTKADPVKARKLLEARADDREAGTMLADMMARGEGGPADVKGGLAILRQQAEKSADAKLYLGRLLIEGKVVGKQPVEAITSLFGSADPDAQIEVANLLRDYHVKLVLPELLVERLSQAADVGEPGAALALARLKLSDNAQFTDADGARNLLKPLVDAGDRAALWLYAGSQYSNLGSSSFQPYRREGGLSDAELKDLVEQGVAKREAEALLLKAMLLRGGVLYPQDDRAATKLLMESAESGNIEAMLRLGDAYDDGLGTQKNPRERLNAWREAARLGSLAAREKLARAFVFDGFDRLMTLEEGITGKIVLYINGDGMMPAFFGANQASMEFNGLFQGRAMEAGTDAVADAVMNAFREAPAGLEDKMLVGLGKAFPDEIRLAIEQKLKKEGFLNAPAEGYFGPEVRLALAQWVEAKGPVGAVEKVEPSSDKPAGQAVSADLVSPDVVARLRDAAFKSATSAKSDKQRRRALQQLNLLARYGDLDPRWGLLRNYHQAKVVRRVVSAAEITRYGLDLMVAKPQGMDKLEFEFIFTITQIYQDGKSGEFGKAVLDAIRDDARLQDPLQLGGVLQQMNFAPGACDAVLAAARKAGVQGVGSDGCDETTMSAVIAFAKEKGPSGTEAKARKAAAEEIKALAAK